MSEPVKGFSEQRESAFLCYSQLESLEFAKELRQRLVQDGIDCYYAVAPVKEWDEKWLVSVERGLESSDQVVLIMSPDFVAKELSSVIRLLVANDGSLGQHYSILTILHRPCEIPAVIKSHYMDVSTNQLFEDHYPHIRSFLGGSEPLDDFIEQTSNAFDNIESERDNNPSNDLLQMPPVGKTESTLIQIVGVLVTVVCIALYVGLLTSG